MSVRGPAAGCQRTGSARLGRGSGQLGQGSGPGVTLRPSAPLACKGEGTAGVIVKKNRENRYEDIWIHNAAKKTRIGNLESKAAKRIKLLNFVTQVFLNFPYFVVAIYSIPIKVSITPCS